MPRDACDTKFLVKIARAYYGDGLTQKEIGERLGLSRIKVSRLLREARERHVVEIRIISSEDAVIDWEQALEVRYGLDEVLIAEPLSRDAQDVRAALGETAAQCLVRGLRGDEVVSLTWGNTLLAVVDALMSQDWPEMRVVQALGGLGRSDADVYGADLVHRMAQSFGAKVRILPAPGIVASREIRDALLSDPQIADTLALAAQADIALVGIGRPSSGSVVMQSQILTVDEADELRALGAVGDIGLRFFDAKGRPVLHELDERIIGLTLGETRTLRRVVGVAGGEEKAEVIRAALRGGLIDVLVTDGRTAQMLLDEEA